MGTSLGLVCLPFIKTVFDHCKFSGSRAHSCVYITAQAASTSILYYLNYNSTLFFTEISIF